MKKTTIKVKKMDCPSEVKMIEHLFEGIDGNIQMEFDLSERTIVFYHSLGETVLLDSLKKISLPGEVIKTEEISTDMIPDISPSVESKVLIYLLVINFTMFIVEVFVGFYAQSTGLIADGLDMLADSLVYSVSLYAVGKSLSKKNQAASLSGIMQIGLGFLCIFEVARKYFYGSEPLSSYIITISIIALLANLVCLALIHKHKDGEIHMKASWIFSANDVLVNLGVIISGVLVYFLQSNLPDLIIGGIVSLVVIRGGITIIKLSKNNKTTNV